MGGGYREWSWGVHPVGGVPAIEVGSQQQQHQHQPRGRGQRLMLATCKTQPEVESGGEILQIFSKGWLEHSSSKGLADYCPPSSFDNYLNDDFSHLESDILVSEDEILVSRESFPAHFTIMTIKSIVSIRSDEESWPKWITWKARGGEEHSFPENCHWIKIMWYVCWILSLSSFD